MVRFGHCSALATINPHELFLSFIEFISFVLIERLVLSVFRLWISFGPLSFESSIRNDQLHETFVRFVRTVEIRKRFKVQNVIRANIRTKPYQKWFEVHQSRPVFPTRFIHRLGVPIYLRFSLTPRFLCKCSCKRFMKRCVLYRLLNEAWRIHSGGRRVPRDNALGLVWFGFTHLPWGVLLASHFFTLMVVQLFNCP